MEDIAYQVRGFLTVRTNFLRVALGGSLVVHADQDSGLFTGDLDLHPSTVRQQVLGASLFSATAEITADSPIVGRLGEDGRMVAVVTVDAVIALVRAAGQTLLSGGSCRTASRAVVPLRSEPGFTLDRGGRLAGAYQRPPFTGCGLITPLVNLSLAGGGNTVVIDLVPAGSG